ncbi:hypothetical protein AAEU32_09930 [Pseudoalteromonas sp. SSDWG2]|uniref:hypothetical protein n=1 Tax=Pseudoalteromonas sp. SSDWG2 TaxID=3139391 RepID=UPI003BA9283E
MKFVPQLVVWLMMLCFTSMSYAQEPVIRFIEPVYEGSLEQKSYPATLLARIVELTEQKFGPITSNQATHLCFRDVNLER